MALQLILLLFAKPSSEMVSVEEWLSGSHETKSKGLGIPYLTFSFRNSIEIGREV